MTMPAGEMTTDEPPIWHPEAEPGDEALMRAAIAEARLALEHADVPVGALAVVDGEVIASAHNRREVDHDPCGHAEMLVLRDAAERLDSWRLDRVTLVVTLEPCPMCAGAAWGARVKRIVFGAHDERAGAVGSLYNLAVDPRLNHQIDVTSGVLAEECGELLTSFFASRRG